MERAYRKLKVQSFTKLFTNSVIKEDKDQGDQKKSDTLKYYK